MFTGFFVVGLMVIAAKFFRRVADKAREIRYDLAFLMWLVVPIAMVILLRSVLYDSWRHLFFVYPAFILIALSGVKYLFDIMAGNTAPCRIITVLMIAGICAGLAPAAGFMIKNHPYGDLYFNGFAGKDMQDIKNKFELDYWGLSYRKALEYVLAADKRPVIRMLAENSPGQYNASILPANDRKRLKFVNDRNSADYFMSNYRWHKEEYPIDPRNEVFSVKVGNAKIMVVYKLK